MSLVFHGEPFRPARRAAPETRAAGCRIDVLPAGEAGTLVADWRELLGSAAEPCPFAAPEVLLPAALHLSDAEELSLVAIRDSDDGRLLAVIPLAPPDRTAGLPGARLWRNARLPVSTPPVARSGGDKAVRALLVWLRSRQPEFAGLDLPGQVAGGEFMRLLAAVARGEGLDLATASAGTALPLAGPAGGSGGCRDGIEHLLRLDAAPERLRRGQAMLQDVGLATFLRAAARGLARSRDARVALADEGGAAVSARLLVRHADGWRVWLAAGRAEAAEDALPLVDAHVTLAARGSAPPLADRARRAMARALWLARR
jgi:hypothetical protein